MTHTYVVLEVSVEAFDEIRRKILDAGYDHAIEKDTDRAEIIDMHGIAIKSETKPK